MIILNEGLSLRKGDRVETPKNLNFDGQKLPAGSKGKVTAEEMSFGSNSDIYVIDFGKGLGKFDFYSKDVKYLKVIGK